MMVRALVLVGVFVLGAALHTALGARWSIGPASPDFLLLFAVMLSLGQSGESAAVTGFLAGVFHSSAMSDKMLALTISRMFACLIAPRIFGLFSGSNAAAIAVTAAGATLIAGIGFLFLGVRDNILGHLTDTIASAIYNGVIAIPVYGIYRRLSKVSARV